MTAEAVATTWEPACFDELELALWRDGDAAACKACEPWWHAQAKTAGRCNGIPGFVARGEEDEMDEIHSQNGAAATAAVYAERRTEKSAVVSIVAPCDRCGHAPVCRLRQAVESLARISASVPRIDDAVTVALTGTVECGHFVKGRQGVPTAIADRPKRELTEAQLEAARRSAALAREAMARKRAERSA